MPWPYNVLVHLAAWSGLRAAELAGLQIGDVEPGGSVRVERSARPVGANIEYLDTKTDGSFRKVPLPADTVQILRDYLAVHPSADVPTAPLFPGMTLVAPKPTGVRTAPLAVAETSDVPAPLTSKAKAHRQASALANLSVSEAEERLQLNWGEPLRHATFYKAVYRPGVLRANRFAEATRNKAHAVPADLKFHSLRHTYASLCALAGIKVREVALFMGHANVTTTEHIHTHLFNTDDHSAAMSAPDAMAAPVPAVGGNVVPLRR